VTAGLQREPAHDAESEEGERQIPGDLGGAEDGVAADVGGPLPADESEVEVSVLGRDGAGGDRHGRLRSLVVGVGGARDRS
jgi:hypothetical protein